MKLGVISDSHDRLPALQQAVALLREQKVDAFFHAGDFVAPFAAKLLAPEALGGKPLYAIFGNNDGERAGLRNVLPGLIDGPLRVELAGTKIAMAHFVEWFDEQDHRDADVLISGHNHEASIEHRDGRLYLNPGECCGWLTGRCTCAVLHLSPDGPRAELLNISV